MNRKYAYANIKIPIEIKDNGKIEPMKEYIQIDFSPCHNLPNKKIDNTNILNNLNDLFTNIPSFENENIIKFKSPYQTPESIQNPIPDQTTESIQNPIPEMIPTDIPISSIKQYKKREGASGGTVGSPESFKNKKRNKFNITAKMR